MHHRKIIPLLLLVGTIACLFAFTKADDDPIIKKIVDQLNKWADKNPPEKVYLQLDKPYYAAGEDIWLKAYVTIGSRHELSNQSSVLNVELIDDRDSIKQRIKLPLISGLMWGDLALPDTLHEGNYRIRAYTNWMRNASAAYFFDKRIAIVNSSTNKIFTKANVSYAANKVNTTINYTDLNGAPYTGKTVRYELQSGDRTTNKGKGITDDKGNINLNFTNVKDLPARSRVATYIVIDRDEIEKDVLLGAISAKVDVQFFPESGGLVDGIPSKVAFKAVGADGLGANVKGDIIDDKNNIITTFTTQHLGMGEFTLQPDAGKQYSARITYADGSVRTVGLPPVASKGYVMSITNADPYRLALTVTTSKDITAANPNDVVNIIAQSGGEVMYAAKSKPGNASFSAFIAKNKFPSGIVQFTLFSSTGEPLNERLVFIQNPDLLKLSVSTERQVYSPRGKVTIHLNTKNSNDTAVQGSFSVAVTDETKVPVDENAENTIVSDLLLTSDLKGYVEQPNYYFNKVTDQTQADLDILMLTKGYHRFEWKQVMNDVFPVIAYQPERSIDISGHVETLGGKPVPHAKVSLFSSKGGSMFLDTMADEQGKFAFRNLLFGDSARVAIQARTDKGKKDLNIVLDDTSPPNAADNNSMPGLLMNINDGLNVYLQNSRLNYDEQMKYGLGNHTIALKEVVVKERRHVIQNSSNLNGAGHADQVIDFKNVSPGCQTLEQCLEGRLVGVFFKQGLPYSTRNQGKMAVMVNNINVSTEFFVDVDMNQVESIEVLRSVVYLTLYGPEGNNGVIVVNLKKGGSLYATMRSPGIITYSPQGYYKFREFYSPKYDDPKTNAKINDLRTTIYWNPNIITDKKGDASFDLFNADSKGNYRVVVEGIDNDGNIGRQVYHYRVE